MTAQRITINIAFCVRISFVLLCAAYACAVPAFSQEDPEYYLMKYMKAVREYRPVPPPREEMYGRNDVIYCTSALEAAKLNNSAADKISAGEYEAAKTLLERGMKKAPLFFPYLYNTGLCYLHLRDFDRSLIYLNKAKSILPEFSRTYLQLGYTYQLMAKEDIAIEQFREALRVNLYELDSLILIGDIYYNRNQVGMAEKYYRASLVQDPAYANGLIGLAKIQFYRREYGSVIITLKGVNTEGEYDKALHYYYAESSYKVQDYRSAYEQYAALLEFKNDKFFISHARSLIKHKLDLAAKFVER